MIDQTPDVPTAGLIHKLETLLIPHELEQWSLNLINGGTSEDNGIY